MNLPTLNLFQSIKDLLHEARRRVVRSVNTTMVHTYFEIGRLIIEHEQGGNIKAEYGAETLKQLSSALIREFGKGFSLTNLKQMRTFYLTYQKGQTVSDESFNLSWSHYIKLMRIPNPKERQFYETEALQNNWSLKEFQRQFDSSLYERILFCESI